MIDVDNPQVRMAAERTLLAWIRTGLAVMALGFALARHEAPAVLTTILGVGLIALGVAAVGLAAWGYARLFRGLDPAAHPERHHATLAVWFAVALALAGMALAAAVLLGQPPAR